MVKCVSYYAQSGSEASPAGKAIGNLLKSGDITLNRFLLLDMPIQTLAVEHFST